MEGEDWFREAIRNIARASDLSEVVQPPSPCLQGTGGGTMTASAPVVLRHCGRTPELEATVMNAIDAAVIGLAQSEARETGHREPFQLWDGSSGLVDAEGRLYPVNLPQG